MAARFVVFELILSTTLGLCTLPALAADSLTITTSTLAVTLDSAFPRVISYQPPVGNVAGQATATRRVELNGKPTRCRVTRFGRTPATAAYTLIFPEEMIAIELTASVTDHTLDFRVSRIDEWGSTKLKTLAFPDNALLSIDSTQPGAALAACHATNTDDQFSATFREHLAPLIDLKAGDHDTGNYLFLSAGPLAAGLGCSNFTDVQRTAWRVAEANGVKICTAQNPVWEFRAFDDEPIPAELPWVKVFITPDRNGDTRADWQDAAIVYRRTMPT